MAIDRRRFLGLPVVGVSAMVVGNRLGILAWLKSYFSTPEPERARSARELHENALQSMIFIEMHLDVLRRQSLAQPLASELGRLQGLVREECLKHWELMRQTKAR